MHKLVQNACSLRSQLKREKEKKFIEFYEKDFMYNS
jgi:hypothetical protein